MGEAKRRRDRSIDAKSEFPFAQHQAIAHATAEATLTLLDGMHTSLHGGGSGEGSPLVQGAISGLLQFMVQSAATDADIQHAINKTIGELLPQIRDAIAHGEARGSA